MTTVQEIIQNEGLKHSSYVTLLSDIIDAEPSNYKEVAKKKGKESISSRRMMSRMKYLDLKGSS